MNTNYIISIIGAIILLFASCERTDELIDLQLDTNVIGEWQVYAYIDGTPVSGAFQLDIKNTSQEADSITIREIGYTFWNFTVNAAYNDNKGLFNTDLSICQSNEDEVIGVKIDNGKAINSDSIYFEIKFEDDVLPFGTTYQLKGHRLK